MYVNSSMLANISLKGKNFYCCLATPSTALEFDVSLSLSLATVVLHPNFFNSQISRIIRAVLMSPQEVLEV